MKSTLFFRSLFLVTALSLGSAVVHAEDIGAVKARMEQRLSAVDGLKDRKVVGENNRGYLEERASLKPDEQQVVSSENSDRAAVYAAIAAQYGTSSDDVGRQRATKIAATSRAGVWIQSPDGSWAQKR